MINNILKWVGLMKIKDVRDLSNEPFTDGELDSLCLDLAISRSNGWDRDKYEHMLELLKKNPEFAQFLDWTVHEDMKRAFNVTDEERPIIRGAVSRTRYLRSLCIPEKDVQKVMRNKITRYAK